MKPCQQNIIDRRTRFSNSDKFDYIMKHTNDRPVLHDGVFVKLSKDMKVFKQTLCYFDRIGRAGRCVRGKVIVNLIIPAGTSVFIGHLNMYGDSQYVEMKCRAEKAFVHSQFMRSGNTEIRSSFPVRYRNTNMVYSTGKMSYPRVFDPRPDTCSDGIHFFVTLYEAYNY